MRRFTAITICVTALIGDASAFAQTPAPPRDASPAAVEAWVKANIVVGPYLPLETTDKRVSYYVLDDLGPTDARVRAWTRDEFFAPQSGTLAATYRSVSMLAEVDCAQRRWRFVAMDWYPELNFKGERISQDAPDARWTYEREKEARSEIVFGEACKAKLAPPTRDPFR